MIEVIIGVAIGTALAWLVVLWVRDHRRRQARLHRHTWSNWERLDVQQWRGGVVTGHVTKQQRTCTECGWEDVWPLTR